MAHMSGAHPESYNSGLTEYGPGPVPPEATEGTESKQRAGPTRSTEGTEASNCQKNILGATGAKILAAHSSPPPPAAQ